MNKGHLWAALLFTFLASGGVSRSPRKIPAPQQSSKKNSAPGGILLLGDSQSVSESSPGARLARALDAERIAKGGKTAYWFIAGPGRERLDEALARRPRWVIVFLGSNELANVAAFPTKAGELDPKKALAQAKGHKKLRAIIEASGAKALFVGPPAFGEKTRSETGGQPLNNAAPLLVPLLEAVYSPYFIDARPLTPPHTGVHFFGKGEASAFASALVEPILQVIQ